MDLHPAIIRALDAYWTTFFACGISSFDTPQTLVVPHAGLGNYHGIFLFRRAQTLIISVPSTFDAAQRVHLAALTVAAADPLTLFGRIPTAIDKVVGPAFIGYADPTTFVPCAHSAGRLLHASDAAAWNAFRAACPAIDWEHGGSPFNERPLAGCFLEDQLVALAGYACWGTTIAHLAVVTHPAYRGRGYGKSVVSVLSDIVLKDGLIPQYRTLASNTASMTIGAELGFFRYAESLAVRLA